MEIRYGSLGVDINYISCNTNEIDSLIEALEENYSCVTRLEINILDANLIIFIYYFGFSGKRAISKEILNSYDEISKYVSRNGVDFRSIIKQLKIIVKQLN